ncbi:MAG TPA: hypothetical protein VGD60_00915 [Candidatus Acidoferrales bacterium]
MSRPIVAPEPHCPFQRDSIGWEYTSPRARLVICIVLAAALALVACSLCAFGATDDHFSVLILDGSNGKPIANLSILVGVDRNDRNKNELRGKTDADGRASFYYKRPLSSRVSVILGAAALPCPKAPVSYPTEDILSAGVVAKNTCDARYFYSFAAVPGQLVVFAKPLTLWERIIREL